MKFWLALVSVAVSCTSPPETQVCTLIGCNDGLNVQVNSSVAQALAVTVRAGSQIIGSFRCDAGAQCSSFIDNQTPAAVNVTVEMGGRTLNRSYTPAYRTARPNGEGCPPACKQATIAVAVD